MIIDDIISRIDVGGPQSYYSFETFVQHLLKHHIESQNKVFQIRDDHFRFIDAVAPDGFDSFEGSTLIDIKFNLAAGSIKGFISGLVNQYLNEYIDNSFENLLVVSAKPIPGIVAIKLKKELEKNQLPFKIIFWGPIELNKIVIQHSDIVNKITSNLFSLRLETAIKKPSKDWVSLRDGIIENLKDYYKKGQFSLLLGAGVSSSAGMPDWNMLLNSLFVSYLTKEFNGDDAIEDMNINEIVSRLNKIDEPSALMAARYLRKGLSKRDEEAEGFILAVTKNLYSLRDMQKPIDSDLIKSIASMCLPRRTGAKVKAVITYNFDDLLERQLKQNTIHHSCIYTNNESYDPDELPIYHVHGFLPEDRNNYDGLDNSTLVFSEEGYHQIYSDSYHWSNLVQLNTFRENNCLMIGLSMTDPNIRRLLEISSRNIERSKHFSFMKRLSIEEFCYQDKKEVIKNSAAAKKFLDSHHTLNEELMKELGVTIIWYESYDEIPVIMNNISKYEK